jgi:hypothetical protein
MINAIRQMPSGELENTAIHDPFPAVVDGIPIKIKLNIDAREGLLVELRSYANNWWFCGASPRSA